MIAAELLSTTSQVVGWLIYLPLLCWAIWRTPWVELCSDQRRQHLLAGTALALFVLWLVRRDFDSGLSYHLIGMTVVALLLDWPLAMLAGLVAQLGLLALGRHDLAALGVNGVLLVVIPVWVTEVCALWVEKKQSRNLFVYIFFSGFLRRRWPRWCAFSPRSPCCGLMACSPCRPGWRILSVTSGW